MKTYKKTHSNNIALQGHIDKIKKRGGAYKVNGNTITYSFPIIVTGYHGTKDKGYGSYKYQYFSADLEYAKEYSEGVGRIIKAEITFKNPFVIEAKYMGQGEIVIDNMIVGFYRNLQPDAVEKLEQKGFDGILVNYGNKKNFEIVPFKKEQIKEIK